MVPYYTTTIKGTLVGTKSDIFLDKNAGRFQDVCCVFGPSRLSAVNLFLPVLLLPLVGWHAIFSSGWTNLSNRDLLFAFAGIFFLNWGHTVFTLTAFFEVPAFSQFLSLKRKSSRFRFAMVHPVLVGGVLFALCSFIMWSETIGHHRIVGLRFFDLLVVLGLWGTIHVTRQFQGLSLFLNRGLLLNAADTITSVHDLKKNEYVERVLFTKLILCLVLFQAFKLYGLAHWLRFNQWGPVLILSLSLLIFLNGCRIKNRLFAIKKAYLLRVVVLGFSGWTPLAVIAVNCLHGLEYYLVSRQSYATSPKTIHVLGLTPMAWIGAAAMSVMWLSSRGVYGNLIYDYSTEFRANVTATNLVSSLAIAIFLTHFYLDGFIYRFHDPHVRKSIGQLFYGHDKSE